MSPVMKILVIEDNPLSAKLVEGVLAAAGYPSVQVKSAERAIRMLDGDEAINLVVCDMELPGMNGLDFIAAIRQRPESETLPVIMCTAHGDVRRVEAALRSGCIGYVLKPLNPRDLIARVRSAIGDPPVPESEEPIDAVDDEAAEDQPADDDVATQRAVAEDAATEVDGGARTQGTDPSATDPMPASPQA
jgi:CheY-like chemotaxis protein